MSVEHAKKTQARIDLISVWNERISLVNYVFEYSTIVASKAMHSRMNINKHPHAYA